ncbi:13500_t:CDS:2 [Acaulospora colombiana]|uniref:13500_t:CDS:1 n=1 Tax=Acaulospora colombiana TaxID=27376 RepID=A0ACA9NMD3_9GLOM|nr:13500_t:CDS:2 [Acaulospora colombiana]
MLSSSIEETELEERDIEPELKVCSVEYLVELEPCDDLLYGDKCFFLHDEHFSQNITCRVPRKGPNVPVLELCGSDHRHRESVEPSRGNRQARGSQDG